jgi:hypothetical protein
LKALAAQNIAQCILSPQALLTQYSETYRSQGVNKQALTEKPTARMHAIHQKTSSTSATILLPPLIYIDILSYGFEFVNKYFALF